MRRISLTIAVCYILSFYTSLPVQAQLNLGGNNLFSNSGVDNPAGTSRNLTTPTFPLGDEPNKEQSNWVPASFPSFPTRYLSIPSLDDSEKEILSQNYFVVINESNVKSFAQLYTDNRADGISNFVTADSIVHPLFALQNNIRLKVIERSINPCLESLLISMIRNNEIDYGNTEDAEIKEEIKYNLAFLTVAVKLLTPDFPLPNNVGVRKLVTDELNNFKMAKLSRSVIFNRLEDFSSYNPIGFYRTLEPARRFYSCFQWLAKSSLELSDTASDTIVGNGNTFRRAVLLYQSIAKSKIQSNNLQKIDSGLALWKQINKIVQDLSIRSNMKITDQDTYLLPDNLAQALNPANGSEIPVSALSNPLNRARLLLTIRSNAPRQFNSTSIFSLSKRDRAKEKQLKFHLFLPLYTPLQDLSLPGPPVQHDSGNNFNYVPVALLLLHNNDVNWANRTLAKNSAKLDEQFMIRLAEKQNIASFDPDTGNSFWKIFGTFSNPWPNSTQLFFQTEQWRTFCLERQAAAWVDNFIAINVKSIQNNSSVQTNSETGTPVSPEQPTNTNPNSPKAATVSSIIRKFGISSWRTSNNFNYLEPALELYSKLAESQSNLETSLNRAEIFPAEYLNESHDFIRLLKRLASIAKLELALEFPQDDDQSLLATIDKPLSVVESPLAGKLFITFPDGKSNANSGGSELRLTGVNMELGYPATIFAIIQYKRTYYLLRGATYSYSEQSGEEINDKHWQRQVEFGFLETPFWCQTFQRTNTKPK